MTFWGFRRPPGWGEVDGVAGGRARPWAIFLFMVAETKSASTEFLCPVARLRDFLPTSCRFGGKCILLCVI